MVNKLFRAGFCPGFPPYNQQLSDYSLSGCVKAPGFYQQAIPFFLQKWYAVFSNKAKGDCKMELTLGKRIAMLRRQKELRQEDLAQMLEVSPQAVSKWENDQTCPDITLLPRLAEILGVTVDELLSGKTEVQPAVKLESVQQRKDIKDMMLRIVVDSADGDKVRVNFPLSLVQLAVDAGMELPQISGKEALSGIDLKQILELVSHGVVGNLIEVDSADGDVVRIFVE